MTEVSFFVLRRELMFRLTKTKPLIKLKTNKLKTFKLKMNNLRTIKLKTVKLKTVKLKTVKLKTVKLKTMQPSRPLPKLHSKQPRMP